MPAANSVFSLDMKNTQFRDGDKILFRFRQPAIEAGDLGGLVETFGLEHLPTGPALRPFFNSFGFVADGFDEDRREIEIPEIRALYRSFRQAWPYWFFACDLEMPSLQAMTFCCLPSLQVVRQEGAPLQRIRLDKRELANFVLENFRGMNLLFARAGMTERENRERSQRVFEYYQRDWACFACP
jgi:hypothetical protein